MSIFDAQNAFCDHAHKVCGAQTTGIGYKRVGGEYTREKAIIIGVKRKLPEFLLRKDTIVPKTIDGYPTDVIRVGKIKAFEDPTGRFRPAPGGVSIGHRDITAGTLGGLVRRNGETLILSNRHVLTNTNAGRAGDPVLQPGRVDGGAFPDDHIADVLDVGPKIDFSGGDNLVDADVARPRSPTFVSGTILEIGRISGSRRGELGNLVKKFGRTTRLTFGETMQVNATADVGYSGNRVAHYVDQVIYQGRADNDFPGFCIFLLRNRLLCAFICRIVGDLLGPFCPGSRKKFGDGGDSGSWIVSDDDGPPAFVALLFAGSNTVIIGNQSDNVLRELEATVV